MARKTQPGDDSEYRVLLDRSMEELRLKTAAHDSVWQLSAADWSTDQDTGLITFTGNTITATASVQIIGTYDTSDGTWLWGWDHPSVHPPLQEHARRVREYGEQYGIAVLTTRKLACDEMEAWEFTALACHLSEAQGAYRGPAGMALVFMTFGDVTLTQCKGKRGRA
jgi:hypothetical protein